LDVHDSNWSEGHGFEPRKVGILEQSLAVNLLLALGRNDSYPPMPPTLGSAKVGEVAQRSADRFMLIHLRSGGLEMVEGAVGLEFMVHLRRVANPRGQSLKLNELLARKWKFLSVLFVSLTSAALIRQELPSR